MTDTETQSRQKPVMFMAFANDRVNHTKYLRNLPNERRGIRGVLKKAQEAGLCEIVDLPNATLDEILDVFQDNAYKDRIAIFHFGGHADCYRLLLETCAGGRSPAMKDGLVAFLSRQKGLKLVFLNGCSTEQHALDLKQAGIPAIIATSQAVDDQIACILATRFYNGIANGLSIDRAWREAGDHIKIWKGTSNLTLFYRYDQKAEGRVPWTIHYKEGAGNVKQWNLPDAANDPLFCLPPIPRSYKLPHKPFIFLEPYQRKHAQVFFGRSRYIRGLYNRVTDRQSAPIILLYGQSGVGKSSLLEAGLLPRLEGVHNSIYLRRDEEKGLSGTIEFALQKYVSLLDKRQFRHQSPICEIWKYIERRTRQPLVVIMDQVEEVYNHPSKHLQNEMKNFIEALSSLFTAPNMYPEGKIILGYRKDYHAEIVESLKFRELDYSPLFLKPLNRNDIMEIVTGLTCSKPLRDKYNLNVGKALPMIIAENLLEDKESPVAPTLQIILTKMWDCAQKDRCSHYPDFAVAHYQALRKNGVLLRDFFKQQMQKLNYLNGEAVESGLALDLLKFHTTPLGTARSRKIKEIRKNYSHVGETVFELVGQLKQLYLLSDTPHKHQKNSLAHDTLAPIVIETFNQSDKPGQRAIRILAAKLEDFKKYKTNYCLDDTDLAIVEQGKNGMRKLVPIEKQLLAESKKQKLIRGRKSKRDSILQRLLITVIIITTIFAGWKWKVETMANANYLSLRAQSLESTNPTLALRMAEKAWCMHKSNFTRTTIDNIYWDNVFYKKIIVPQKTILTTAFAPTGDAVLTGFYDSPPRLWHWKKDQWIDFKEKCGGIVCAVFSRNGKYIATGSIDKNIRLWDLNGNLLETFPCHNEGVNCISYSPDHRYLVYGSMEGTVCLLDLLHKQSTFLKKHNGNVTAVAYSPAGKYILTGSADKTACLLKRNGQEVRIFDHGAERVMCVDIYVNGQTIYALTGTDIGVWRLWDINVEVPICKRKHEGQINSVLFSPDGKHILTNAYEKSIVLWDLKGNKRQVLIGHKDSVTISDFTPDGRYAFTVSDDNTIRMWQLRGYGLNISRGENGPVRSAAFFSAGKQVISGTEDGSIRICDENGQLRQLYRHDSRIVSIKVSTDGSQILGAAVDGMIFLWESKGKKLESKKPWNAYIHKADVLCAAISPDNRFVLSGSADKTACLWEVNGKLSVKFEGHENAVTAVTFSPDGKYILTGSSDYSVKLWDKSGNQLKTFKGRHNQHITSVAFSPDGENILTGSYDNTAILWDLNGNQLTCFVGHKDIIHSVAFSPNRNNMYILTGSADKTARLWNRDGEQLQVFSGHDNAVYSVAFSPDGARILTGSGDGSVRLWKIGAWRDFLENNECQKFSDDQLDEYAGKN